MYSNKMLNFQESTTILNAQTKKSLETYRMHLVSIRVPSICQIKYLFILYTWNYLTLCQQMTVELNYVTAVQS